MTDSPVPVLDFSQLDAGPEAAARFRADLRQATHEVGFFALTGHGASPALQDRLLATARAFFALPDADKLAIENLKSPQFHGYARLGGELTQGRIDWREQIDIGPGGEPVAVGENDPAYLALAGPNLWPAHLPELREVIEEADTRARRVAKVVEQLQS